MCRPAKVPRWLQKAVRCWGKRVYRNRTTMVFGSSFQLQVSVALPLQTRAPVWSVRQHHIVQLTPGDEAFGLGVINASKYCPIYSDMMFFVNTKADGRCFSAPSKRLSEQQTKSDIGGARAARGGRSKRWKIDGSGGQTGSIHRAK